MLFKEIAIMFKVSERTLRRLIKSSENEEVRRFGAKKGSGTYFYSSKEVDFLISNIDIIS